MKPCKTTQAACNVIKSNNPMRYIANGSQTQPSKSFTRKGYMYMVIPGEQQWDLSAADYTSHFTQKLHIQEIIKLCALQNSLITRYP